jgi:hypothetical protein
MEDAYVLRTADQEAKDGGPHWVLTIIHFERQPPPMLGVIAGEVAHSVRSALDHLAYQLVNYDSRRETHSGFPIATSPTDYFGPLADRTPMREKGLPGVAAPFLDVIDNFQPFKARPDSPGDDPLAMLANFANRDKHRFIHPVFATHHQVDVTVAVTEPGFQGRLESVPHAPGRVEDGAVLHRYRLYGEGNPTVQREGRIAVDIAFGNRPFYESDLRAMRARALDVIEALEDVV